MWFKRVEVNSEIQMLSKTNEIYFVCLLVVVERNSIREGRKSQRASHLSAITYYKRSIKEMHANQSSDDDDDAMNNLQSVGCLILHCITLE
jgi:hypothetical protein